MVQPQLTEGSVRILSASTMEGLEIAINQFLAGDETVENHRKVLTQSPTFTISGGIFYAMLVFARASQDKRR